MLDGFDLTLLNLVQRDDSQTADQLAEAVPPAATVTFENECAPSSVTVQLLMTTSAPS